MLTRRGLLAGLLALPVARALVPSATGPVSHETVMGIKEDTVLFGPTYESIFGDDRSRARLIEWNKEVTRAYRERTLCTHLQDGVVLYRADFDPKRLPSYRG